MGVIVGAVFSVTVKVMVSESWSGNGASSVTVTVAAGYEPASPSTGLQSTEPVPLPLSVNTQVAGKPEIEKLTESPTSGSDAFRLIVSESPSSTVSLPMLVSVGAAFSVTVSTKLVESDSAPSASSSVAVTVTLVLP